jgi:hypothetical protein
VGETDVCTDDEKFISGTCAMIGRFVFSVDDVIVGVKNGFMGDVDDATVDVSELSGENIVVLATVGVKCEVGMVVEDWIEKAVFIEVGVVVDSASKAVDVITCNADDVTGDA